VHLGQIVGRNILKEIIVTIRWSILRKGLKNMQENGSVIDQCLAYQNYIYNFVYKMTCDAMLSEEIVQETFIKAMVNADKYEGRSELKTWLIAIAKNEVYQHINKQKKDIKRLEEIRKCENAKSNILKINEYEYAAYINQIRDGCLFALIMCLPYNQRCAFILYVLNEIPIISVAEILGKTENATRILISRAKLTIRSFLCDNCEHISSPGKCRCVNMADFSLKNNLIEKISKNTQVANAKIELRKFKDEIDLIKIIPGKGLSNLIIDANFGTIFSK
jgi:RNA polymerase sigma-70 factor (ECF subfamily)